MLKKSSPLHISVITLFPDIFKAHLEHLPIKRALEKGLLQIDFINLRDFAIDKRGTVDSPPYGGGPGMILRPEPIFDAINYALSRHREAEATRHREAEGRGDLGLLRFALVSPNDAPLVRGDGGLVPPNDEETEIIFLTPRGKTYNQATASHLSTTENIIVVCGRYEGVDQRVVDYFVHPNSPIANVRAQEISIGNYVLSGGEVATMVIVESITRLIPGAIENQEALANESFNDGKTEYPQYSRPEEWKDLKVPVELFSGHHENIKRWKNTRCGGVTN